MKMVLKKLNKYEYLLRLEKEKFGTKDQYYKIDMPTLRYLNEEIEDNNISGTSDYMS